MPRECPKSMGVVISERARECGPLGPKSFLSFISLSLSSSGSFPISASCLPHPWLHLLSLQVIIHKSFPVLYHTCYHQLCLRGTMPCPGIHHHHVNADGLGAAK